MTVIQVASGDNHCLALTRGGKLYSWGSNDSGQLGLGPMCGKSCPSPQPIECLTALPIRLIACGGDHSVIISNSGAVYAWGKNNKGQLGLGDTENRAFPTQVRSLRNQKICYVACGAEHTICLTEDGGVFSFGSGQYGQLGHGSKSDEHLPRKIIELMGTEVSQVACGKKHSLAFVPTRGRLYAFGLGGSGQLGHSAFTSAVTPQVVHGPWIGPTGEPSAPKRVMEEMEVDGFEKVVITRIGAGGDQSYALVNEPSMVKREQADFRQHPQNMLIETLTSEVVEAMMLPGPEDALDQDFLERLEVIFQHPACLTASFLLPNHKPCTSKNDGIDFDAWRHATKGLTKLKNDTIKDLVTTGLSKYVLPKLELNPPDVETLRQYLTYPLFGEFENESLFKEVHCQYARGLISLPKPAWNVVEKWFANQNRDYLLPLVNSFKKVVVHILNQRSNSASPSSFEGDLGYALVFLRILNRINVYNGCIVSYEDFYIPEINEYIDLPDAYIRWIVSKARGQSSSDSYVFICDFPFVFDASAKTILLQTDQAFQMHNATQQAHLQALGEAGFRSLIHQQVCSNEHIGNLICAVRRDHIVEDTLTFIACVPDMKDFKKPLKVKFDGEEADDAGGVRKEFFLLLLKEILDPKYGMFKEYEETHTIWFHPYCFEDMGMFFMIGVLCGLAIYNFTIINLPFPLVLYKKLLSDEFGSVEDLEDLSPSLAKGLRDLLAYDGNDVEDVFSLNFAVVEDVFGEPTTHELKPNGETIPVTNENREEYVKLYCDYVLNKSVERLYAAFHAGFHKVCGGRVLDLFHARELMALVVGTEKYDWEELERNCDYKVLPDKKPTSFVYSSFCFSFQNGYDKDHQTVKFFWEVFHSLSEEEKKKFLLFLTGTDRIPILGMTAKRMTIQKTYDANYLPVAHTCFNLLDLPEYATKEKLKYKLLQAIHGTQGFGLV